MEQVFIARPTWDDAMTLEMHKEISEILQNWEKDLTPEDAFDIAKEIPHHAFRENGYELAKRLENDAGISPDSELVESLDCIYYKYGRILTAHIKNWVSKNNLTLKLPIGSIVEFVDTTNGKTIIGEITRHFADELNYGIWWDGCNMVKEEGCRILASDKVKNLTVS